ncbi:hypothetical protein [Polaribacter sp. Hel1_85]|uniref:hypothetical protein n=1 Tax=Polaribacter sp. Hel1_85 TaxID=1250005 RepID=UPI00052D6821|nr:hypothetical protein [Polaribacter sp. Hel1_85]KGL63993.1 hypothetical protein PHEL85_1035 [Polaribacter sp. Hel1_85]
MENNIKNSEAYLNSVLGKESGFSIPKNYFNTTEDAIEAKIAEENFTKNKGFKVPDSYFKELENDILAKVTTTKKETKVISLKERILKAIPIAAAASVILFIGLNSFIFNKTEELTLDSLSDNEIENWLDTNILNTNDIALILNEDIFDENDFYFATLEDENIEDYINSIDNTSILNELD